MECIKKVKLNIEKNYFFCEQTLLIVKIISHMIVFKYLHLIYLKSINIFVGLNESIQVLGIGEL